MKEILASRTVAIPDGGTCPAPRASVCGCAPILQPAPSTPAPRVCPTCLPSSSSYVGLFAVTIKVESRKVTVTGPRGSLSREFKHISIAAVPLGKRNIRFDMWFGTRLQLATIRTMTTHIENMIVGVTKGYCYRMRFAYAHFPINVVVRRNVV